MKPIIIFITLLCISSAASDIQKIKLTDVKALTLKKNHQTIGRRVSPRPQLQCRGRLCNHSPDTIQCINVGTDGIDVQWKCEADLQNTLSFSAQYISCEGFDYPDDPYILVGSCFLSYTLRYTTKQNNSSHIIFIVLIGILFCGHSRRHRGGDSNFIAGALGGAAVTAALLPRQRWRRRRGRSIGSCLFGRSGSSTRRATGFCGTKRH